MKNAGERIYPKGLTNGTQEQQNLNSKHFSVPLVVPAVSVCVDLTHTLFIFLKSIQTQHSDESMYLAGLRWQKDSSDYAEHFSK